MSNNGNNGKGSSMAVGVIAFAIIVAIIVIFFTISAKSNGGSPAKPVNATETVTEVADNESDASDSISSDVDTEDESDVDETTDAENEDEPAEETEETTEAEDEEAENGIVECPNCEKMVSKLERFKPSEDYAFVKLWCADCCAEVEDGTNSVDDIDFDSDVDCDGCGETFSKHTEKNSIKNNGFCPDCYESYKTTMKENGVDVL